MQSVRQVTEYCEYGVRKHNSRIIDYMIANAIKQCWVWSQKMQEGSEGKNILFLYVYLSSTV